MRYITSIERAGIKKGREEGFLLGLKEAHEEGRLEGIKLGTAKALCMLLEMRFGPSPLNIQQQIQAADLSRLRQWFEASIDAKNLHEVFG